MDGQVCGRIIINFRADFTTSLLLLSIKLTMLTSLSLNDDLFFG